jgi:hypothetical protein
LLAYQIIDFVIILLHVAAIIVAAAKISQQQLKHAASCGVAHGVATMQSSTTKIADVVSTYYFTTLSLQVHLLVREKMWWWLAIARKRLC